MATLRHPALLAYAGRGGILPTADEVLAMVNPQRFIVPVQKAAAKTAEKVGAVYSKGRQKHEGRSLDTPPAKDAETFYQYVEMAMGPPLRPSFAHDNGHLDKDGRYDPSKKQVPVSDDYVALMEWIAMLEGAEALRPDLIDGTTAYRHFLFGHGAPRTISYERYLQSDSSGARLLQSACHDAEVGALRLHDTMVHESSAQQRTDNFTMYSCSWSTHDFSARYPYPATENWQNGVGPIWRTGLTA